MSDFLPMGSEKLVVAAVGTISGGLTFFFGVDHLAGDLCRCRSCNGHGGSSDQP